MSEKIEYVTEVSKLQHFPYKTAEELFRAFKRNEIRLGVDRGTARQWAMRDKYSPLLLRVTTTILSFSPYLIMLALAGYLIWAGQWFWLLTTPLVFFASDVLNPGSWVRYGFFRFVFMAAIIIGLFISFFASWPGMFALALSLLAQWICVIVTYKSAQNYILNTAIKNEYTVCQLWQGNALHVFTPEGDRLTQRWRTQNGEHVWYDKNE